MNKLKAQIDYFKLWLTFLVTIDAGSTAWIFNNAGKVNPIKFYITFLFILLLNTSIFIIHKKHMK